MNEGLTIAIPTYNREKQLLIQLNSILKQDLTGLNKILIIDNNSNYDLSEKIHNLNHPKIHLVKNRVNIGMAVNMSSAFNYVNKGWLWILSDDDELVEGSVAKIVEKTNNSNHLCWIKYSINEHNKYHDIQIGSLEGLVDYFDNTPNMTKGDMVFISNNLFNMSFCAEYVEYAFAHSYSYIGFMLPALKLLDNNQAPMEFSSDLAVSYKKPVGRQYSFKKVGLGLSTISYIEWNLKKQKRRLLYKMLMSITPGSYISWCKQYGEDDDILTLETLYNNIYKYTLPFSKKIKLVSYIIFLKVSKNLFA
ncbi:glycosyltransferase family 2 protein [Akkermansiaceae bacterium]|nr:glycosyltransferase family 2 protein [Akkermansiaceae bacterium]MDA7872300.1 glycosyltransferase family 2 protein [Akkermansiaceae bacterium]